jgi:hypothetical protein
MVMAGVDDPEALEAMACREGMALAADLYVRRVKLASDCANVIKSININEVLTVYGQVVREIRITREEFEYFDFVHEGRRSNGDAHDLARGALYSCEGRHIWLNDPPEGVCNNILIE